MEVSESPEMKKVKALTCGASVEVDAELGVGGKEEGGVRRSEEE